MSSTTSAKSKIIVRPTYLLKIRDKSGGASTTNSAVIAKGASSFAVASATGLAVGKTIRLGVGEYAEPVLIANLVSTTVTPTRPVMRDHVAGEAVVEQTVYDLGEVSGTAQLTINGESQDFEVETRRLIFAKIPGYFDCQLEGGLVGTSPHSLAAAWGVPVGTVYGSRTSAAPLTLATDGGELGTETNQFIILQGFTLDGSAITLELWGAENDYTGVQMQLARGQGTILQAKWIGAMACVDQSAVAYTRDTSIRPGKGDLLASITEIGFFEPATTATLATTLNTGAAAAAQTLDLTSATNLADNDWILIGDDADLQEAHRVNDHTAETIVTKLYRAQGAGVAVVKQKQTSLGGIEAGSVQLATGGSVDKIRIENSSATIGLKAGSAAITLTFKIVDAIASALARAMAVPAGDVSSGRFTTENAGTSPLNSVYLKGKNLDGETVYVILTGCSQQIQNLAIQMTKKGVSGMPYSLTPSSVFMLTVNS